MEVTKEKCFRAFFRTKKKVEKSEFGSDRVFLSENGSLIVIEICDSNTICDEIHRIRQIVNDEELTIMLLKKYQVILKDIEESYEKVQKLLSPRFNVRDFCLSECTFFVDKDGTYSVELDYDFEEANLSSKSILLTSSSKLGLNIDSKIVKEALSEVGNLQRDVSAKKATKNGYAKVEATGRDGITRSTEDMAPVRRKIKNISEFVKACEDVIKKRNSGTNETEV